MIAPVPDAQPPSSPPGRRFLVVVRAGDQSLHRSWLGDPATRTWDLAVSYYGSDPEIYRDPDVRRFDDAGTKMPGLHALLTRDPFWRAYDYVWLADDDLAADQGSIDALFALASRLDLALAQPSLSWASYYSHGVTLCSPSFVARFTNFVEIMCPCFSREFLETCLPTFDENLSGWGLDELWPRLRRPSQRLAILDAVRVTHTRPVGGPIYKVVEAQGRNAKEELLEVRRKYAIPPFDRYRVEAAITRRGRRLERASPWGRLRIRALLTRDHLAFRFVRRRMRKETS